MYMCAKATVLAYCYHFTIGFCNFRQCDFLLVFFHFILRCFYFYSFTESLTQNLNNQFQQKMWSDMKNSLTGYLYTELKENYIITLVDNSWQHATEKLKLSCDETKMQYMSNHRDRWSTQLHSWGKSFGNYRKS